MKLAILSDTHDRYDLMGQAVEILARRGAQYFIHCGDICQERMLDHLAGLKAIFVWGNCDWDPLALKNHGASMGIDCHNYFASIELDGKQIAVTHGDDRLRMQEILAAQQHDYLFHGHTHVLRDERAGRTRIINPGALHRCATRTAALLDTQSDALEIIHIA